MGQEVIIFLDANVIIYQVEAVEPFQRKVSDLLNGLMLRHPHASFAVSRLSMLECLVKPVREQDSLAIARFRGFFYATDLKIVEITGQIIEGAILLRAGYGLRTPDAIQAASALSQQGPVILLTGDQNFRKVPGLHVELIA